MKAFTQFFHSRQDSTQTARSISVHIRIARTLTSVFRATGSENRKIEVATLRAETYIQQTPARRIVLLSHHCAQKHENQQQKHTPAQIHQIAADFVVAGMEKCLQIC